MSKVQNRFGTARSWARVRGRLELITAVMALLAAVVSSGALPLSDGWLRPERRTEILSPGMFVEQRENLSGSLGEVPAGSQVWAVTRDGSSGRYFPQDHPCEELDGSFRCGDYWIGPNTDAGGHRYTIYIVAAPASSVMVFMRYQLDKGGARGDDPGLDRLPDESLVLTYRDVVRDPP